MKKMKDILSIRKRYIFIIYIALVTLFSFGYMFYWWIEPNSFIVNERIGDYFVTFDHNDVTSEDSMPVYYQYQKIRNICEKRLLIYSEIKRKELEEKEMYDTLTLLNEKTWQGANESCKDDCLQKIEPQVKKLDSLERVQSWLKKVIADNDSLSKSISNNLNKLLNKIGDEITIAKIKLLEKYKYESHYSNAFLEMEKGRVVEKANQLRDQINALYTDSLTKNSHQWYEDSWKVREILRDRVKWIDFFYYSLGIATTTTFGDLVANNTLTKTASVVELLLCLVLLTILLNVFKKD